MWEGQGRWGVAPVDIRSSRKWSHTPLLWGACGPWPGVPSLPKAVHRDAGPRVEACAGLGLSSGAVSA